MAASLARTSTRLSKVSQFQARQVSTLGSLLDNQVSRFEHRDGLLTVQQDNSRYTFGEMKKHVDDVAAGLCNMGLKRGDVMGLWLPNDAENVLTHIAASKLGLTVVPLDFNDPTFSPLVKSMSMRGLMFHPSQGDDDRIATVQAKFPEVHTLPEGFHLRSAAFPNMRWLIQTGFKDAAGMVNLAHIQWDDAQPSPLIQTMAAVQGGDVAVASGSGSVTVDQLAGKAEALANALSLSSSDKVCLASAGGPFTTATTVAACLMAGAELVLPSTTFHAAHCVTAASNEGATVLLGSAADITATAAAAADAPVGSLRLLAVDAAAGAEGAKMGSATVTHVNLN